MDRCKLFFSSFVARKIEGKGKGKGKKICARWMELTEDGSVADIV